MRPLLSATGMNSSGDTMPRAGWFQRASASTLRRAGRSRDCGWTWTCNVPSCTAVRSSDTRVRLWDLSASSAGS